MKDIALDDLIKEDKDNARQKNKQKAHIRGDRRGRGRLIRRGQGSDRSVGKFNRDRPDKRKPINRDNRDRKGSRDNTDKPRNKFNRFNNRNNDRNRDRPRKSETKREPQSKQKQQKHTKQQGPKQQKGRTLKVLGLHPDITNEDLYKLFAAQGALEKCMIQQDNFGRNLPSAIVKYYAPETSKKAIEKFNDQKVLNSVLKVEPYKNIRK